MRKEPQLNHKGQQLRSYTSAATCFHFEVREPPDHPNYIGDKEHSSSFTVMVGLSKEFVSEWRPLPPTKSNCRPLPPPSSRRLPWCAPPSENRRESGRGARDWGLFSYQYLT